MMTTKQRLLETKRYVFEKDKIKLPNFIRLIAPREIRETILVARDAACAAFHALKRLDEHYDQRFYRLCPTNDITRFERHCFSVQRLLSWKADYTSGDLTLAPTPKFPACVFRFHVDERAYNAYVEEHEKLRLAYLNGPYLEWRMKGRELEDRLTVSGVAEVDKRYCQMWWCGFVEEMKVWETRFDDLVLPSWREMINKLATIVETAVDLDHE